MDYHAYIDGLIGVRRAEQRRALTRGAYIEAHTASAAKLQNDAASRRVEMLEKAASRLPGFRPREAGCPPEKRARMGRRSGPRKRGMAMAGEQSIRLVLLTRGDG